MSDNPSADGLDGVELDEVELDEVERYELREPAKYLFEPGRRDFLQTLGAGLLIVAAARPTKAQQRGSRTARREELLSERFHVGEDGMITVFTSKVEVGQGSRTQITQAAAEEFHIPLDRIRLVMADTELCPDDGGTAGSRTTPSTVPRVRNAAAAAFELLASYAAARLGVQRSELQVRDGQFAAATKEQKLSLADLAKDKDLHEKLKSTPPANGVTVTPIDQWKVLGTPVPKVGGRDIVTGTARYASDIVRPGMLYGKVLRPVSYGAKLQSIDLEPARQMTGVSVVREGDFLGCTAPTTWQASQALAAIAKTAVWERPAHPSSGELFELLKRTADRGREGGQGRAGAAERPRTAAERSISVQYTVAYVQHAPMETRCAVAEWENDKLTVWTGTQQPARVQRDLCTAFQLPDNRVRVIVPDTGGGFGGKHSGEAAVEAARLAKGAGKPVLLRWTREEEFTWAYFRPAGLIEVTAGIDDAGAIAQWEFTNYNSGQSAIETPYRVADRRVALRRLPSAAAAGVVPGAGLDGQHIRPRVGDGRAG